MPYISSKAVTKILQKVLWKMLIKALSKPIIRKAFKIAKFVYNTLTRPSKPSKSDKASASGDGDNKATEELSVVIDDLLTQLSDKFSSISEEMLGKSECLASIFFNLWSSRTALMRDD